MSSPPSPPAPPAQPILDELPVGIWVARAPGGELLYANRTFGEIMGQGAIADVAIGAYTEPYGIYDREGRLYPEDRLPFVLALRARATVVVDDLAIHRPDGRRVPVRAVARPVLVGDVVDHIVIAFFDVTREVEADAARRAGEREVEATRRMQALGSLASGVAHDFNNLLTVIQVVADRLSASERDADRLSSLRLIDQATSRAAALTRSLLQFAARAEAPWTTIGVNDVVAGLGELLRETLGGVEVELRLEASDGGRISGDRVQLEQLLVNLATNAREAMRQAGGGRLLVATRDVVLPDGPGVLLQVVDDGPGIPVELRERVLEPFFTTKTSGATRGIGLAIVQGIVERHGGTLAILGAPSGRGTLVEIRLPAAVPPHPPTR